MTTSETTLHEQNFVPGASIEDVATDILKYQTNISLDAEVDLDAKVIKTREERIRRINTRYRKAPDMGRLTGRQRFVPGRGNIHADVMFLGEMPSGNESVSGLALDGQRRHVILRLLKGIDCREDQTYTTYLLKYRTPNGRSIRDIEVAGIKHLIEEEIMVVRPRVIVTWGRKTIDVLIPGSSLYGCHGKVLDYNGIPVIPMFSPDAVMLNPDAFRDVQRDFQTIHKFV